MTFLEASPLGLWGLETYCISPADVMAIHYLESVDLLNTQSINGGHALQEVKDASREVKDLLGLINQSRTNERSMQRTTSK